MTTTPHPSPFAPDDAHDTRRPFECISDALRAEPDQDAVFAGIAEYFDRTADARWAAWRIARRFGNDTRTAAQIDADDLAEQLARDAAQAVRAARRAADRIGHAPTSRD